MSDKTITRAIYPTENEGVNLTVEYIDSPFGALPELKPEELDLLSDFTIKAEIDPGELTHEDGKYKGYKWSEAYAVAKYYEDNAKEPLAELIERREKSSEPFSKFLADYFKGKSSRPCGVKKSKHFRDCEIFLAVHSLMSNGSPLKSNNSQSGAAAIIGEERKLEEETVISIYKKILKTCRGQF